LKIQISQSLKSISKKVKLALGPRPFSNHCKENKRFPFDKEVKTIVEKIPLFQDDEYFIYSFK